MLFLVIELTHFLYYVGAGGFCLFVPLLQVYHMPVDLKFLSFFSHLHLLVLVSVLWDVFTLSISIIIIVTIIITTTPIINS